MEGPANRTDRCELLTVCPASKLADFANDILADGAELSIRQAPRPQLLMQQVVEPVERRPFNLGEVVVTPAEVDLDGSRGFAIMPGKAERAALSGAIVDAAVAGGHPLTRQVLAALERAGERHRGERTREWAESKHTTVTFETLEDER